MASSSVGTTFSIEASTISALGSVCVRSPLPSLVTMHRAAGLGDQKIRAGDADIGGEEFLAQHRARLGEQRGRLVEIAVRGKLGVDAAEIGLDLLLGQMHRRRDDVRGRLAAQLDDVFAQIGLDRRDAVFLEEIVDADLLADHRLALGHGLGLEPLADFEHRGARLLGRRRPMHLSARLDDALFVALQIEIEMRERVVLDVARLVAQRLDTPAVSRPRPPAGR